MQKLKKSQNINLELAELVKQLNNAMDIANLGMFEWDVATDSVSFDKRSYEIMHVDPNSFDHTIEGLIKDVIHPDSISAFKNALEDARKKNKIANKVYRLNDSNGQVCWVKLMSRIIMEGDQIVKLIGVVMDVSRQVLMAQNVRAEAEFIEALIENVPSPIFFKNAEGRYQKFNKAFLDFLGLSREEVYNKSTYDVAPYHLAELYEEADKLLMQRKTSQKYESLVKAANNVNKNVVFRKAAYLNDRDEVLGIIGVMEDVTELRIAERTLRKISEAQHIMMKCNQDIDNYETEKEFLHNLMLQFMTSLEGATTAGLLKVDQDRILSLYDSHGLSLREELSHMVYEESYIYEITQGHHDRVGSVDELSLFHLRADDIGQEVLKQNIIQSLIVIPITYNGEIRWFFIYGSSEPHGFSKEDKQVSDFIRTEMDALIKSFLFFQQTLLMARYDGVTGLMNRAYFDKTLGEALMDSPDQSMQVVLIDLDNLKIINDIVGHDRGDACLKQLGDLLSDSFAGRSFWGRIGGDEFAGLVYAKTSQEVDQVLQELQGIYQTYLMEKDIPATGGNFSYGISSYLRDGKTYQELLKVADRRMYAHKNENKKKR
jgi:diguanylate cyclase (GGDEF)-like protein/PAS domain S-box-containing protein